MIFTALRLGSGDACNYWVRLSMHAPVTINFECEIRYP